MHELFAGRIVSIETVTLKFPHRQWDGREVDPDKTYFPDLYHRHLLYITRIFFIYGPPEEEFIGKIFCAISFALIQEKQVPAKFL